MKQVTADYPWLSEPVIEWLESILRPEWTVIETGAGGSTVFFASRVSRVVTFENNPQWAEKVTGELNQRALTNVDLRFDPAYPTQGILRDVPANCDLAFIDGRGRVRSACDALLCVKPDGWIVLDDSDRERYAPAVMRIEQRAKERRVFESGPDHTTAWRV